MKLRLKKALLAKIGAQWVPFGKIPANLDVLSDLLRDGYLEEKDGYFRLAVKGFKAIRKNPGALKKIYHGAVAGLRSHQASRAAKKAEAAVARLKNPGKFHGKIKRCVEKIARRKGKKPRSAYAVCTASVLGKRRAQHRRNPASWVIKVQKHARGPVLTWNGHSFTNQPGEIPQGFPSQAAAVKKATRLLSANTALDQYKIFVMSGYSSMRLNPSSRVLQAGIDKAAQKLEDFTGHPATHVERVRARSKDRTGLVLGPLKAVEYEATRDGSTDIWRHKFNARSRPLLSVSTDGKQLHVVGGRYEFTEAGIEDRG